MAKLKLTLASSVALSMLLSTLSPTLANASTHERASMYPLSTEYSAQCASDKNDDDGSNNAPTTSDDEHESDGQSGQSDEDVGNQGDDGSSNQNDDGEQDDDENPSQGDNQSNESDQDDADGNPSSSAQQGDYASVAADVSQFVSTVVSSTRVAIQDNDFVTLNQLVSDARTRLDQALHMQAQGEFAQASDVLKQPFTEQPTSQSISKKDRRGAKAALENIKNCERKLLGLSKALSRVSSDRARVSIEKRMLNSLTQMQKKTSALTKLDSKAKRAKHSDKHKSVSKSDKEIRGKERDHATGKRARHS